MKWITRFYGSCGHVEDEVVTEEEFKKWAAPRVVPQYGGGEKVCQAQITTEDGAEIVHLTPDRFCICLSCINEIGEEFDF